MAAIIAVRKACSRCPTTKNVALTFRRLSAISTPGVKGPGPSSNVSAISRLRPPPRATNGLWRRTPATARCAEEMAGARAASAAGAGAVAVSRVDAPPEPRPLTRATVNAIARSTSHGRARRVMATGSVTLLR